jgi:hypothetical protein
MAKAITTMSNPSARSTADLLAAITSGKLEPALLTYAAEELGSRTDADAEAITDALLAVLRNSRDFVREGALLGLCRLSTERAASAMVRTALQDKSANIRGIAKSLMCDQ